MVHVIAISFGCGYPAGRGMGLLQEAGVDQIGHYVANSCWTETILMMPGQGARTHWLTCGDVSLDNGGEDLPLAGTDLSWGRHNLGTPKFFRCRSLDIRFNSRLQCRLWSISDLVSTST